jgi:hypothetical protein
MSRPGRSPFLPLVERLDEPVLSQTATKLNLSDENPPATALHRGRCDTGCTLRRRRVQPMIALRISYASCGRAPDGSS